ncbi:MAG: PEP-CTERM sorting domain-containing protein [Candidatus Acidiferrales bacterium]
MKKLSVAMILGIALLAPLAMADPGNQNGCGPSNNQPKKCDDPAPVPEPGIAILVGSGLLALGGFALARRKKAVN